VSVTAGSLLGGRVPYCQPAQGHRSGIEPVLLAASIPARAGARVLEGGSGAGAGLLCLAARVPDISGLGLEVDAAPLACALANAARLPGLRFEQVDLTTAPIAGRFDHAMANPPWHPPGTLSSDAGREMARRATASVFVDWARALAAPLRHHGSLTFVLPAAALASALAALTAAGCGSPQVFPLWPRVGRDAKLLLLRAIKGGKGPARVLAGLVLHEADGGFTPAAQAILRDGQALLFG